MKARTLLCLCFSLYAHGQEKDVSGIYYSDYGTKIEIVGNEFNYIIPQTHSPIWYNDTLAKCTFKWIDDNLIELNSTPPNIIALKGLKVVQSSDSTINDSIKVSFSFPQLSSNLKISVNTNTFKDFSFTCSKSHREVMIPNNVESISFYIEPERLKPHTSDGLFYGIVGFDSFQEYQMEKGKNHVLIEIPAIDDSFFERYYIKGCYAKISNGIITWNGDSFKKDK